MLLLLLLLLLLPLLLQLQLRLPLPLFVLAVILSEAKDPATIKLTHTLQTLSTTEPTPPNKSHIKPTPNKR